MQTSPDRWLLPEGIDEIVPPQAVHFESLRRRLLDLFGTWGYELVIPPFIEYLESLHISAGSDLELQTFKLTDQLTGRLMAVRADMTPQVARIDAHHLQREGPVRLCYMGTVLHTRPDGFSHSRSPFQVGAELYGYAGIESDVEVLCLMLATLEAAGAKGVHLDLGHVGIFQALVGKLKLGEQGEAELLDALQRKAHAEIAALLESHQVTAAEIKRITGLADLNGGSEVLPRARHLLKGSGEVVLAALAALEELERVMTTRAPGVALHFDLAELRGYRYHPGLVFAAFVPGHGQEVARGGRYDGIGAAFGRSRPATGFSTDLNTLMVLGGGGQEQAVGRVFAPWSDAPGLLKAIDDLRARGEQVVQGLPDQAEGPREMDCDCELMEVDGAWVPRPLV